jgi:translocation and assembly module TamA
MRPLVCDSCAIQSRARAWGARYELYPAGRILIGVLALCGLAAWFAPVARAADPLPYSLRLPTTGNSALDAAISGSLQLKTLQKRAPAGPFAVITRARQDFGRAKAALESFGYYRSHVAITIDGAPLDDPALPDRLQALPAAPPVPIAVTIDTGPLFHVRRISLDGSVPAVATRAFTLRQGDPAIAANVLGAGAAMLTAMRDDGYAFANVAPPQAVEIPASDALDISFHVTPGPRVDLGPITLLHTGSVHPAYIRRRLLVRPGQLYNVTAIEKARQDLLAVGVFSSVVVRTAPSLDANGALPVTFDFTERPLHAVTFNVAYSTDLGGSAGVTWTHRNIFGNAEQLSLGASITGLGGTADKGIGYDVTAQLTKPDYLRRNQELIFTLTALKQDLDAYDQTAAIAGVALQRKLNSQWTASVGTTLEQEQITQEGVVRDYTLFVLPISAKYDSTGLANPLDDATHGIRANLSATPTESLGHRDATFVILQASASAYIDLDILGLTKPGNSVLALRGLVGTAQGAGQFDLPPDQRFYAGGSATVRGFKYQSVGPLFPDTNPEGGTAIDAATIEFRQRVWGNVGAAVFADAAQVDTSSAPFQGTLREGVGAGVRYYTPIGPVRVDIAVPLNRPPGGDSFELYLGLGQAF